MIRPRGKELVVVIGSTGTGKSKLAIELLTSRFSSESFPLGGEIINGDSMQVYKGLDVMTNKVRDIETRGIRHHLMSFLDIDQDYTVERFRTDATEKVREIHDKNLLPIIVGGTGYYIQNLVFPGRLVRDSILAKSITGLTRAIDPKSTTEDLCLGLYEALKVVDPIMAQRWHWRNLRKVRRSLEVIVCSGKRMSSLIDEQDRRDESVDSGNEQIIPYRTLIFWLYSEPNQLNQRLDSRVEKMLKEGLIEEVRDLKRRRFQLVKNMDVDYSRGPYQAIGTSNLTFYNIEFERIVSLETDNIQESEISTASDLTKLSTRQYAKAQVKWMKSKFLPELNRSMRSKELEGFKTAKDGDEVLIYLLDSSDLERWKSDVFEPAQKVLNS
ncbi:IPP transferase-domain-containing protein [Phakopsora pachyrhizi]|nr:IPP transferase-domain-containing protein [Phakopsora pachyrhizi]